jgi:hypothetical protein
MVVNGVCGGCRWQGPFVSSSILIRLLAHPFVSFQMAPLRVPFWILKGPRKG